MCGLIFFFTCGVVVMVSSEVVNVVCHLSCCYRMKCSDFFFFFK